MDEYWDQDYINEAVKFVGSHPVGKADVQLQRACYRHPYWSKELFQQQHACEYCTHETDARDFCCEICYRPMEADKAGQKKP